MRESERITKEREWLSDTPGEFKAHPFRDMVFIYFRPSVFDKYKNNKFCSISRFNISFLGLNGNPILVVEFVRKDGKLMVRSRDYAYVPPRERPHWEQQRLEDDNDPKMKVMG
jgi:hypothetical protein